MKSRYVYEFGPFELDPNRRQLHRAGSPVALTPKAFDTLLALVEHHGAVVEKDALMRAVWGDTIVEEVGLARNISVLRKVLGERRDEHRYIVTVPGRGYRFVDDVRKVQVEEDAVEPAASADEAPVTWPRVVVPRTTSRRLLPLAIVGVAGLAALAAIIGLTRASPPAHDLTKRDAIVIADFVNATGDTAFDRVLAHALTTQLEQSPFLTIFPDARVRETLRMMGRAPDEPLSLALARKVSLRHGIKAAVGADIRALGDHYVLTLEAANAQTGETVARAQIEVTRKEAVLRGLSEAVKSLRERLGESLDSIARFYTPIEAATTASLEALQLYSLGRERVQAADYDGARRYYGRAVEVDPDFAIAWNAVSDLEPDRALAEAGISRAYALRDRTSEIERLRITITWHEVVTGNLEEAIREAELFRVRYPRAWWPYWSLGLNLLKVGQNERALPHAQEVVRLNPDAADHHFLLAETLSRLGRDADALAACRQAGVPPSLFSVCGFLLDEETQGPVRTGTPDAVMAFWRIARAISRGQWTLAQQLAAGPASPGERDAVETRVTKRLIVADALLGTCHLRWAAEGIEDLGQQAAAALGRALCGDLDAARHYISQYATRPDSTLLHGLYLPTVRAALALRQHQTDDVFLALAGTERFAGVRNYWPAWLRGQAHLLAGDGRAAALEFRTMLAHQGLYLDSPLATLAHLGLAQAAALDGDVAQSRTSYEDFFQAWKEADADLPILVAAREEYASLR